MTVLITMAGLGSRFSDAGYQVPKYRVLAHGKTLFAWSLHSLRAFFDQPFIFACLDSEDKDWILHEAKSLGVGNASFKTRPEISAGQAETAYDALEERDASQALWVFNIDTHVRPGAMLPTDMSSASGCLHVFPSTAPNMSFVAYDDQGDVARVVEKQVISEWATVGMYGFSSVGFFRELYHAAYKDGQIRTVGGERYIAPMYDLALAAGKRVIAPQLAAEDVKILGTPEQVRAFDSEAVPPLGH